ncbi:MAG: class I SAM-dependent methyltransferase, partial [Bacteroidetes bacterium]|nr:class I SAM-dependent methyltransferase [Bacteroidota bacterium]
MQEEHAFKVKDFLVSGEDFSLRRNTTYGYLETHPQPRMDELSGYYESEEYISHTDSKKGVMSFLYQTIKNYSLKRKLRLINRWNDGPGSILDVGAGTGEFLKVAQEGNWKVSGVEVNKKAIVLAQKKGVALSQNLDDVLDQRFDVITLWHVLEHLPNLESQIEKLHSLLNDTGVLIIAVPNFKSYDAKYYKEFWAAFDVPRHLWHFSEQSMKKLLSRRFVLRKTLPMIFDAFYVSLLSEKYR